MIRLSKSVLRGFQFGDENSLQYHANNINVWNNVRDSFPHPYLRSDAVNWISAHHQLINPHNLAISVDDLVVGGIGIIPDKDIYKINAEIGYWLGEEFWGEGIMTEAIETMVLYVFEKFEFSRLYAGVFETNPASMRVLEKAGFKKEAIHQKSILKNGRILDEHYYSILKS